MTEPSPPFGVNHIVSKRNENKQNAEPRFRFTFEARTWDRDAAGKVEATALKIMDGAENEY
jgi:hypothetical protein